MYELIVEVKTVSYAKKIKKLQSFIVREPFSVDVKFTNIGSSFFPGGQLTLLVAWSNGQGVTVPVIIPELDINKDETVELNKTEALAEGFGLILIRNVKANDGNTITLFDIKRESIEPKVAIHSIPTKTWEEIYTYWALIIAVISLIPIAVQSIWTIILWIF